MRKKHSGFTLIEMMITVATLAIIVAIAFPSFQEQIQKTRRADGKALLTNVAQQLERCYTRFGSYDHDDCPVTGTIESEDGFYQLTIGAGGTTVSATTYSLRATPQGAQASDTVCSDLILSQAGEQDIGSGATGPVERCW